MSNHKIEVVLPLAGQGQRFKDAGILTPKPLILYRNKPLFIWALNSLREILPYARITLVFLKSDIMTKGFCEGLNSINNGFSYQFIELGEPTSGPAETLLQAASHIRSDLPFLSLDCDLHFSSKEYFDHVLNCIDGLTTHGAICTFASNDPRFSFAATD